MAGQKLLLDTNIFIALEDPKVVPPATATFAQKAHLYGLTLFLDEASVEDIRRDGNLQRRESTLSKLAKFPVLEGVAHRPHELLIQQFGEVTSANDSCDVKMLDTLALNIVDFLVSEDVGLHKRAKKAGVHRRVFTVTEALSWLQRTYEPREFDLPFIVSKKAHQIPLTDPIFDSIRKDYPGFDTWFDRCRNGHRDCWVVEIKGKLAGIAIYKTETHQEAQTAHVSDRIMKVCTFKMSEEFQGEKFGEQLLKKILWFAQANDFECVYLTAYPKQEFLITLLTAFGFEITRTKENGEKVIEKRLLSRENIQLPAGESLLGFDMRVYPRFYDGEQAKKFVIPIRPEFHTVLFPEIAEAAPSPLFPSEKFFVGRGGDQNRTPGNTIRKVYICRSPTRTLMPGDILLFYMSKSEDFARSQCVTSIGVVERCQLASNGIELSQFVGRRSVYSQDNLNALNATPESPVLVIDFLLNAHFQKPICLADLLDMGVFNRSPSQSIKRLSDEAYSAVLEQSAMGYE
jgi:ribosomal protein S18 acetylase RimI-like enzyme